MKSITRNIRLATIFLTLAMGGPGVAPAQETNSASNTDQADERDALASNIVSHLMAAAETNEAAAASGLAQVNPDLSVATNPPQTSTEGGVNQRASARPSDNRTGDSRSDRRRSSRDSSSASRWRNGEERGGSGGPETRTNSTAQNDGLRPEFSNFRIIADRNIFDPNRRGSRPSGPRERPKTVDSFSLVGIMSYEKGTFAFFDGTSSAYCKALKQNDTIAGYRVETIDASLVRLSTETNQLEMKVGMQLRREDEGPWNLSRQPDTFAASVSAPSSTTSTSTTSQTDSAASGGESDVLKRLRERREKE